MSDAFCVPKCEGVLECICSVEDGLELRVVCPAVLAFVEGLRSYRSLVDHCTGLLTIDDWIDCKSVTDRI